VQAAISAIHARAASHEETDWRQIALLYRRLYAYQPSPVIELNGIVADSFAHGPVAAIEALSDLSRRAGDSLAGYQPFHLVRGDLRRRTGDTIGAAAAYREALALTRNEAEAAFIRRRLSELPAS
jgi:RNA polymerase sigma-70 factor (ECF subfamily)